MKVPKFGEIWWFFPFGQAEECTHAIIYNVREQIWYDVALGRSAGYSSQVFQYPIMANNATEVYWSLQLSGGFTSAPHVGDSIYGSTSGSTGLVNYYDSADHILFITLTSETPLVLGDLIVDVTNSVGASPPHIISTRQLYDCYTHEKGRDLVEGGRALAIEAYAETNNFGLPTGGTQVNSPQGLNRWTRLVRVEPNFLISGEMNLTVVGREFPQSPDVESNNYTFDPQSGKIDTREQFRCIRLRFSSNVAGGFFEQGRILLHTEPGDVRS